MAAQGEPKIQISQYNDIDTMIERSRIEREKVRKIK